MVRIVLSTHPAPLRILDIGCGTGSLSQKFLESIPTADVTGVDIDPTMLWLAETRKEKFKNRLHIFQNDLRDTAWVKSLASSFDAVVSATALHWLNTDQLGVLYQQIGQLLNPGGIFLNADHVGSNAPQIQRYWEEHRLIECNDGENSIRFGQGDDWDSFWVEYSHALGLDVGKLHHHLFKNRDRGHDDGFPLAWHLDKLRESGFPIVDCFWRCGCDAIYGGLKEW